MYGEEENMVFLEMGIIKILPYQEKVHILINYEKKIILS